MNMKITTSLRFAAAAAALLIAGAAQAQTILKFSHTDNPGGSHDQAAADFIGRSLDEATGAGRRDSVTNL